MSDTERISMIWPSDVKAAVVERTGGVRGGITEFTLEAVAQHLRSADDVKAADLELNETKLLAQLLADRIVMGGTQSDRLEALMEVEFPSWMDTSGWPSEFARRVPDPEPGRPEVKTVKGEPSGENPDPQPEVETPGETPEPDMTDPIDRSRVEEGKRKAAEARARIAVRTEPPAPETDPVPSRLGSGSKDDLFAKIAARTGEDMDEVLGKVKTASEIDPPAPKPVEELSDKEQRYARQDAPEPAPEVETEAAVRYAEMIGAEPVAIAPVEPVVAAVALCPNCKEELIDGECWTCG